MSYAALSATATRSSSTDDSRTLWDSEEEGQQLLEALEDAGCRAILEATGGSPMSATELSEACDISLSTTYRKLDLLTEVGLLSEGIRIRRSGKHTSEYVRRVDDIHLSFGTEGGMELRLEGRDRPAATAAQ